MDNKYWRAENELEEGIYGIKRPTPHEIFKKPDLTEEQINKAQENFKKYFYCPVCGKKSLIEDAVIKRYILNKFFGLGNAAMPEWMKISASMESCYIRVCPQCEMKKFSDDVFVRAYDGNAIETRKGKIRAAENSGCMGMIAMIATMAAVSVALLIKLFTQTGGRFC